MKSALALLLLIAAFWTGGPTAVPGAPGDVGGVEMFGKRHVSLADWARANNFEISWLKRDERVQLVNRSARMVFEADAREAEINGIHVWLSYPVVMRNGAAYLAERDLQTTIKPLVYPPHSWSGAKVRNIVLDPGHGGNDPGNQDGTRQEKKYTLLFAQELAAQLRKAGFKVSLTRTGDSRIDLPERPEIARRREADLFISLHWNSTASGRNEVKGAQTYCLTPAGASSTDAGGEITGAGTHPGNLYNDKNIFLAYLIQKSLCKNLEVEDRGVRRARFAVLRTAQMPSVLVEGGFMSHPAESKKIYDSAYRRKMAGAIVDGVQAYKAQVEQQR